jgi:hypothetical protein
MAKAAKAVSRASATRKAPLPTIPVSARARAVLEGSTKMWKRRLARNGTLTDDMPEAKHAAVRAENAREAAAQAALEEEFLASLWPSKVSCTRPSRSSRSPTWATTSLPDTSMCRPAIVWCQRCWQFPRPPMCWKKRQDNRPGHKPSVR